MDFFLYIFNYYKHIHGKLHKDHFSIIKFVTPDSLVCCNFCLSFLYSCVLGHIYNELILIRIRVFFPSNPLPPRQSCVERMFFACSIEFSSFTDPKWISHPETYRYFKIRPQTNVSLSLRVSISQGKKSFFFSQTPAREMLAFLSISLCLGGFFSFTFLPRIKLVKSHAFI